MKYKIEGENLPVLICELENGESLVSEGGAMSWMSPNINMKTSTMGGIGKAFGRAFSGEKMFKNIYTAQGGQGMIAFASKFIGSIIPYEVSPGKELIIQKRAFIASEESVETSVFFQKKFVSGIFGGEGFVMQKISGHGICFIEIDGYTKIYDLKEDQEILVDTGHLAAMSRTCSLDIRKVDGAKNMFLGGEGFFNTVVKGPGKVYIQTLSLDKLRGVLSNNM